MHEGQTIAFVYNGKPRYGLLEFVGFNKQTGSRYIRVISDGKPKCYTLTKIVAPRVVVSTRYPIST